MTTQQPAEREITPAQCTVLLERFFGVTRAARKKATIDPEHGADQIPIAAHQQCQERAHFFFTDCQWCSRLRRNSLLLADFAPLRALTTMSTFGNSC
jgi:hypothetical protein